MLGLLSIKDDWSMQDNRGSDTLQQSVISKSFNLNYKNLEEKKLSRSGWDLSQTLPSLE